MRTISEGRSLQVFIEDLVFLSARLKPSAATADLAGPIETLIAQARTRRLELEQAQEKVSRALAGRIAADEQLDDIVLGVGRAALDAAGGRREGGPYRPPIPKAPARP